MAQHIHVYLSKSRLRRLSRDAGFSKQEYNPREYNRLLGEIKEIDDQLKATKRPFEIQDLKRIKEKLLTELRKYRTDEDSTYDQQSVKRKLFDQKIKEGRWKQLGSISGLGYVWVYDTFLRKKFEIQLVD